MKQGTVYDSQITLSLCIKISSCKLLIFVE